MTELVRSSIHDGYTEIVLNRPERRNALIQPLGAELRDAVLAASGDDSPAVVLLRGEGGAFCSGLDLKAMNADPPPAWRAEQGATMRELHVALYECPKVIVCALEKYAINAGAALALGCDLIVVGEQSYLQVGEVQQGIAAPNNVAWLSARFSEATAASIVYSGRRIPGPELVLMGVALRSVPEAEVLQSARELCAELAGYPPAGILNSKAIMRALGPVKDAKEWFATAATAGPHRGSGGPLPPVR
ncbi:MAG: enoyl-CoA hydratase/isomerase family protein [Dehalococcoidia bacterium]|nr:enoyl-CoA hydratase/isomerase family protein [Dehalococcoidia bacterium]